MTPLPGLGSSFNEPQSNDPTSAPPMPDQQQPQAPQGPPQGLAQALAQRKRKPIGPDRQNAFHARYGDF